VNNIIEFWLVCIVVGNSNKLEKEVWKEIQLNALKLRPMR
jgi:hypothetical protein